MKKFPSVIGITGSIIGAILLVVSFILGKIIWFIAGTFVILTALLVYVFFNIWDKKMAFGPKKPVTAVMSILYVALAAYAVFIVVGDNKAGSMDPMMNGGMDPYLNGMPGADMEGGEFDSGLGGEADGEGSDLGGENVEGLDDGENGESLPADGEDGESLDESLENGESLENENPEAASDGGETADGESGESGETETAEGETQEGSGGSSDSGSSSGSGNSGSSSGSSGSGSVNNSGISATMAVPAPAVVETHAVAVPIK